MNTYTKVQIKPAFRKAIASQVYINNLDIEQLKNHNKMIEDLYSIFVTALEYKIIIKEINDGS